MLGEIHDPVRAGDALLIGLDRVKNTGVLEAVDDVAGYTAAFNRNVLSVLNRELGGNIPVDAYRHQAASNRADSRIEMWLVAQRVHHAHLDAPDAGFDMTTDAGIRTEISRKFTPETIDDLPRRAGLGIRDRFEADGRAYSLVLAAPG